MAAITPDVSVSVRAFVTSDGGVDSDPQHTLDDDTASDLSKTDPEKDAYDEKVPPTPSSVLPGVDVFSGRPDVRRILEDAVTRSAGPVSVDGAYLREVHLCGVAHALVQSLARTRCRRLFARRSPRRSPLRWRCSRARPLCSLTSRTSRCKRLLPPSHTATRHPSYLPLALPPTPLALSIPLSPSLRSLHLSLARPYLMISD